MEFEPPRATEQELLAEQLTEAEVRLVLERLSAEQFECPNATVGAVVEATGTTPITIARILGQIRKTAFEERFAETFLQHEFRLDDVEGEIKLLDRRVKRVEGDLGYHSEYSIEIISAIILALIIAALAAGFASAFNHPF